MGLPATDWNAAALDALAGYAQAQGTTGLLIVQHRRTVQELNWPVAPGSEVFTRRYVHGTDAQGALLEDVASQQKSVTAVLVAMAADRGLLDVRQPVFATLGTGWSKADAAQERDITVLHLLHMESGLDEALAWEAAPGTRHFYNTPAYALMLPVLEAAAGRPINELTHEWLTGPLGMADTAWRQRIPELAEFLGNPIGLVTTPRDLARLGQLVLDGGVAANGTRIVSHAQLALIFQRSPNNPGYGRLWWLNGGPHWVKPKGEPCAGPVVTTAPADAVFAMGSEGRTLMVVPSLGLIFVRLGQQPRDADHREPMMRLLMQAMPQPAS